jgi:hypothetical protein
LALSARCVTVKAIVGPHDAALFAAQLRHQSTQLGLDQRLSHPGEEIAGKGRWHDAITPQPVGLGFLSPVSSFPAFDSGPYLIGNRGSGVRGEGGAPFWVEAQDSAPQPNAAFVQRLGIAHRTARLPPDDVMYQPIVLAHQLGQALPASGLSLAKTDNI